MSLVLPAHVCRKLAYTKPLHGAKAYERVDWLVRKPELVGAKLIKSHARRSRLVVVGVGSDAVAQRGKE